MLLIEYYNQWANHFEDYLTRIDEDQWCPIRDAQFHATTVEVLGIITQNENVNVTKMKNQANDKRCIRELR